MSGVQKKTQKPPKAELDKALKRMADFLADRAGMKQPQLARLETGQVEPKLDTLQRLAKAMGFEVHVSFQPADQRSATAQPMLR